MSMICIIIYTVIIYVHIYKYIQIWLPSQWSHFAGCFCWLLHRQILSCSLFPALEREKREEEKEEEKGVESGKLYCKQAVIQLGQCLSICVSGCSFLLHAFSLFPFTSFFPSFGFFCHKPSLNVCLFVCSYRVVSSLVTVLGLVFFFCFLSRSQSARTCLLLFWSCRPARLMLKFLTSFLCARIRSLIFSLEDGYCRPLKHQLVSFEVFEFSKVQTNNRSCYCL